jgi:hypothetical protein
MRKDDNHVLDMTNYVSMLTLRAYTNMIYEVRQELVLPPNTTTPNI